MPARSHLEASSRFRYSQSLSGIELWPLGVRANNTAVRHRCGRDADWLTAKAAGQAC